MIIIGKLNMKRLLNKDNCRILLLSKQPKVKDKKNKENL